MIKDYSGNGVGGNIICANSKEFLNKYGIEIIKQIAISSNTVNNDNAMISINHKNKKLKIYIENNIFNIEIFSGIKKITHIKIINCDKLDINLEYENLYFINVYIKYKVCTAYLDSDCTINRDLWRWS